VCLPFTFGVGPAGPAQEAEPLFAGLALSASLAAGLNVDAGRSTTPAGLSKRTFHGVASSLTAVLFWGWLELELLSALLPFPGPFPGPFPLFFCSAALRVLRMTAGTPSKPPSDSVWADHVDVSDAVSNLSLEVFQRRCGKLFTSSSESVSDTSQVAMAAGRARADP